MQTTDRPTHSFYYWVGIICLLIETFLYNIATGSPMPLRQKELPYNINMKEVKKGDWIVVEGNGWSEFGCVIDVNKDEINMFDGKEGWTVSRDEIVNVVWH